MKSFKQWLPLIIILILAVAMFFVGKNNAVRLNTNQSTAADNGSIWKIL
jgi:hypothetical protein